MISIIQIIISYFLGSIPTALLLGLSIKGIDIRKFGSGNVGATNAFRVLGKPIGLIVLLFDIFKGAFVTVVLAGSFAPGALSQETWRIVLGLIAIAGHNWSVFLKFRGGKGIATSLGVLFGLAFSAFAFRPVIFLCVCLWFTVFLFSGFVSLASILAALGLPVFSLLFVKSTDLLIFSFVVAIFAIFRHKSNISRLLRSKENRVKLPWFRH